MYMFIIGNNHKNPQILFGVFHFNKNKFTEFVMLFVFETLYNYITCNIP